MFARQIRRLTLPKHETTGSLYSRNQILKFMNKTENSENEDESKPPPKQLKQWRREFDSKHKLQTKLKIFDRGARPSTDFIVVMNGPWDLTPSSIKRWWIRRKRELDIYDQRFVVERHEVLGSNLAAAHFLVHRGARVKFHGKPDWVQQDEKENYTLPGKFEPDFLIEAIDANGIDLYYEGLMNLQYLYDLKYFSLKGCTTIDDWCLDRISGLFVGLEHLDISNCKNVTERGLEALYRMHSLKQLVVTNYQRSAAFDLTCMMLEDCNPNLKCDIREPEPEPEPESGEEKKS